MSGGPPGPTRMDTLFPYTTVFRAVGIVARRRVDSARARLRRDQCADRVAQIGRLCAVIGKRAEPPRGDIEQQRAKYVGVEIGGREAWIAERVAAPPIGDAK